MRPRRVSPCRYWPRIRWRRALVPVLFGLLLLATPMAGARAEPIYPGAEWRHVPAQEVAWSPSTLESAAQQARALNSTALMIVHRGIVIAEWGDTTRRTELFSVRKSLLSALIGIAVADHKIRLDDTLARLGIDDNPPSLTEVEKQATVRMLLQARSGVYHPALYETKGMAAARPLRSSHPPGTFWYYNNWDFNALGTIYERATGESIYAAFDRLIARPIGMQDYRPSDGHYVTGPDSNHRAYPLRMSARDLARFALLYARGGAWSGRQVVPADWVRESTTSYSTTTSHAGYGYLWWVAMPPDPATDPGLGLPAGTFMAVGHLGQFAVVIPARDLVIVNRVDSGVHKDGVGMHDFAGVVRQILHAGGFAP